MPFDARLAKTLAPGEHMLVDDCPGLRLEASASRRSWIYRYRTTAGVLKQVALGQWPALALGDAWALWKRLHDLRATGGDPRAAVLEARRPAAPAPAAVYTVRDLVADHIKTLQRTRKAVGALAARRALEQFLAAEPQLADRAAASITRGEAYAVLEKRADTPTAAARLRALLGAGWDEALDADRLRDAPNWWRRVMKGKLKSKGKIIGGKHVGVQRPHLTPAKVGVLLAWAPWHLQAVAADMVALYLRTATRGSEIASMRKEHITQEADGWWWTVPKALTKNAHVELATDLRVPLVGEALAIVQRRIEAVGKSGWLFEGIDGEQYTQKRLSTYVYDLQPYSAKAMRRNGDGLVLPVTHWTPHHLRRTARTMLTALGCPKDVAEAILGHLPPAMEATYNAHTYDAERRHWLTLLGARLDQLAADSAAGAAGALGLPARP